MDVNYVLRFCSSHNMSVVVIVLPLDGAAELSSAVLALLAALMAKIRPSDDRMVEVHGLPEDALQAVVGLQLDLGGVRLLLHKVKKRLHFPPCEGQHGVQVIHHPVLWREGEGMAKKDMKKGRKETMCKTDCQHFCESDN
ncbi:hypothetical protein EYF80_046403 [Liparis tanakae]|uniref:Uncharacterized protein n=1 Tax=Liparis tanakae TaxID=230148 RepID=A0A4Z2FRS5_9TELE|nr:hypothetical protein EYF80_046403 [Liparis tanakae]